MLKQKSENREWIKLFNNCQLCVTRATLLKLEAKAVQDIRRAASENPNGCAYGYSGGKDSVVLKELIKRAGVEMPCFCTIQSEYPEMERFIRETAPANTEYIYPTDFSMEFLNTHPEYLFPERTAKRIRSEYTMHWRVHAQRYLKSRGIGAMITGRRLEDGNFCGKVENGIYTSRNNFVKSYNIIADWTHEQLLAYIKINRLPLAPIYQYPNGFVFGTHMWFERDRIEHSIEKTFDEVWAIDKTIVINAARAGLIEAQKYIKARGICYEDRKISNEG